MSLLPPTLEAERNVAHRSPYLKEEDLEEAIAEAAPEHAAARTYQLVFC